MKIIFIWVLALSTSSVYAAESLHRLGGYYENNGKKYAICISLFETFWASRGIKAFNGYMTYATDYFGGVPMSPSGFSVAGNQIPESGNFVFGVFDQNNPSSSNPDLMLAPTDTELKGDSLTNLALIQKSRTINLKLKALLPSEDCSLNQPK